VGGGQYEKKGFEIHQRSSKERGKLTGEKKKVASSRRGSQALISGERNRGVESSDKVRERTQGGLIRRQKKHAGVARQEKTSR